MHLHILLVGLGLSYHFVKLDPQNEEKCTEIVPVAVKSRKNPALQYHGMLVLLMLVVLGSMYWYVTVTKTGAAVARG